jgi:hypothetical protein
MSCGRTNRTPGARSSNKAVYGTCSKGGLDRENITTLPQLTAIADRIERLPGIGAKTALAIRAELGRLALLDAQSP